MHLAIVIESSYAENPQVTNVPGALASGELVTERLTAAGFLVERVPASRDLAGYLDGRLLEAPNPFESLIVYYVGYVALSRERGPALLLDGPRLRAFPVTRLTRSIMTAAYSGAVIVDGVAVIEDGQTAQEIAAAIAQTAPPSGHVSALVGVREPKDAQSWMPSRLADLFVVALDWLWGTEADPERVTLGRALRVMTEERVSFSLAGATADQISSEDFLLLPSRLAPRKSGAAPRLQSESLPPLPSLSSWAPASAPASEAEAPLPSFDNEPGARASDPEPDGPERSSVVPSPIARREGAGSSSDVVKRPHREPGELLRLIALYDRDELHAEGVTAREELAEALAADPARRAQTLEEAARIAATQLGDATWCLTLSRRALEADPTALGALELVATMLGRLEAWRDLADVYEHALQRLGQGPIACRIANHLASLLRTRLGDIDGAMRALERALSCDATDPTAHSALAEIHEGRGESLWAIRHRRAEARAMPTSPRAYASALDLFESSGDIDAAWNAASVLVALGAADDRARALFEAYRVDGLIPVQRGLAEADWRSGFLDPERDRDLAALLRVVQEAAIDVRAGHLERSGKIPVLPDSARHDPEKSTTMLARSLLWTSKLLGIDAPSLYVFDSAPGHMIAVPAVQTTSVVSRSLGSGLALGELSFLWARHLAFHRPEHRLLTFFSTTQDLASLVLSALAIGGAERSALDSLEGETKDLARALRRALSEDALIELRQRVSALSTHGVSHRVLGWARSAELVAGRVGLLSCGDVTVAASLVGRFPLTGLVSAAEQTEDLLAYAISSEYQELRSRIGAQVRADARQAG